MNFSELAKKAWEFVEEWGPDIATILDDIIKSLQKTERVTHCGICGEECPAYIIKVEGREVFRGKCPTHGFKR